MGRRRKKTDAERAREARARAAESARITEIHNAMTLPKRSQKSSYRDGDIVDAQISHVGSRPDLVIISTADMNLTFSVAKGYLAVKGVAPYIGTRVRITIKKSLRKKSVSIGDISEVYRSTSV